MMGDGHRGNTPGTRNTMHRTQAQEQQKEAIKLEKAIARNLKALGYGE